MINILRCAPSWFRILVSSSCTLMLSFVVYFVDFTSFSFLLASSCYLYVHFRRMMAFSDDSSSTLSSKTFLLYCVLFSLWINYGKLSVDASRQANNMTHQQQPFICQLVAKSICRTPRHFILKSNSTVQRSIQPDFLLFALVDGTRHGNVFPSLPL